MDGRPDPRAESIAGDHFLAVEIQRNPTFSDSICEGANDSSAWSTG